MKARNFFKPNMEQIYIVPNIWGVLFFFGTALVFITGFVFGNSNLYLFGFVLTTFFVTAMVQTNNNLRGLSLRFARFEACNAGDPVVCLFTLKNVSSANRFHFRVRVSHESKKFDVALESCAALQNRYEKSEFLSSKRGVFRAPRLQISSQYPLGLFFSWKVHRSEMQYCVYPKPQGILPLPESFFEMGSAESLIEALPGNEDFAGIHHYTPADTPGRIAWSVLARGLPLSAKSFEMSSSAARILAFNAIALADFEMRLSQLASWILLCEHQGESYVLHFQNEILGPGSGHEFMQQCLTFLAQLSKPLDAGLSI